MVSGPVLDKYATSPITLFTTNKCHIEKVEITDGTTGANLITSETALLSDVTQYSATGHAVDNMITSDYYTVKRTNTVLTSLYKKSLNINIKVTQGDGVVS